MASTVYFLNFLCSVNSQNHFFVSLKSVVSISKHFCVSITTTSVHCNVSITLLCGVLCGVHIPVKSSKTHLTSVKVGNWMRNQPLSDITSLFLNFSFFLLTQSHLLGIFVNLANRNCCFSFANFFSLSLSSKTDFIFFNNAICHLHSYVYLYLSSVLHWFCSQYMY